MKNYIDSQIYEVNKLNEEKYKKIRQIRAKNTKKVGRSIIPIGSIEKAQMIANTRSYYDKKIDKIYKNVKKTLEEQKQVEEKEG